MEKPLIANTLIKEKEVLESLSNDLEFFRLMDDALDSLPVSFAREVRVHHRMIR